MRKPHNITYKGDTKHLSHWADLYKISHTAFSYWFHDYGIEIAVKLACMSREERMEFKATLRGDEPKTMPELEPYDPDLELKNRIKYWKKQGMSKEEMITKARMI